MEKTQRDSLRILLIHQENTQIGEKQRKTEHILVTNGPSWKYVDPYFLYKMG
jgi:hypothetical protein